MSDAIKEFIIYKKRAPYEQFIEEMERIDLKRLPFHLHDKDVDISDSDDAIYISAKDCQSISIRGIAESRIKGKLYIEPHKINLKIFDDKGEEIRADDAVQFSITEFKKVGLPTIEKDSERNRTVYYYYPYKMALSGLKIKKGIVITKDRRLEIRIIRNGESLKIGKIEVDVECDKWVKKKEQKEL